MTRVYLDTSAILKLTCQEAESMALGQLLAPPTEACTSAIAEVEVPRALRRLGFAAGEGQAALDGLYVIDLDAAIRARAATLLPLTVRSIDALHLATALELGAGVDIVTYDEVLAAAARAHGFTVRQPGR